MNPLSVRQVRRRYLVLHGLRWLPVGLLIPVTILLMQERGLTLTQIGLAIAAQGVVVLALELPTGGFADALGRKPVLVVASLVGLVSTGLLVVADSFALLVAVWALQGVFRALDSGPLESWYVDTTLAADPDARYENGLGQGGTVLGLAMAAGALLSGALVALGPIGPLSALTGPVIAAVGLQVVYLVALLALLTERRAVTGPAALRASVREAPRMVGEAFGLLRRSRVLLALVAVELFWGFGMATFEGLLPIRLAEVVADADRAATLLGPASTAAWLASAGGAALTPLLIRRLGAAPGAALLRILQGITVVGMALFAGPTGVLIAFVACYAVHGASNPLHMGLLHRQVAGPYRTSLISLNSMVAMPAGALGGVVLGYIGDRAGVSTAMLVGAVVLAVAAPLYLPAWRAGRQSADDGRDAGVPDTGPSPGDGESAARPSGDSVPAAGPPGVPVARLAGDGEPAAGQAQRTEVSGKAAV
ncbi:MFS transporter [Micromonospora maris]|uniref:MFS transporter n=1 Tax=Micromonospora maris TaxID=1003110 RepID=A0A9X0I9D3_9ACTN|nr:MFS transporter [Micromonospora maris]AEB44073.1 major facilitator transporter [Micromonospora maris AB-18-032]KUJ49297.1 MFS transporter [Micromonospora maris]